MRNTFFQTIATSLAVLTIGVSLVTTPVLAAARHGGGGGPPRRERPSRRRRARPICRASVWRRRR